MPSINGTNLSQLRKAKRWSLDKLASEALIDRGTIHRIESGKRGSSRQETINRLADALDTTPEQLTGPTIEAASAPEASRKSQMNVRMSDEARNAISLVAMRYKVKPSTVVHLAPLLFLWAAEESLRRRKFRLEHLVEQWDAISSREDFLHLDAAVAYNSRADAIIESERKSIASRDIFGLTIPDDEVAFDYEESEHNPMARFLADLTGSLNGLAEFEHWSPYWDQPGYTLGREEAATLVGGDEDAVHHIVCGNVGLHEIPKDVAGNGADSVAAWVREKGDAYVASLSDLLLGLKI